MKVSNNINLAVKTTFICMVLVCAISAAGFSDATSWSHEVILEKLQGLEDGKEHFESGPILPVKYSNFENDKDMQLKNRKLFLYGHEIINVSSYYEDWDSTGKAQGELPFWVYREEYQISGAKLNVINILANRYTGGRDPGTSYFFMSKSDSSTNNESTIFNDGINNDESTISGESVTNQKPIQVDINEVFRISNVYTDKNNNVWLKGLHLLWRNEGISDTYTLLTSGEVIKWSDQVKSEIGLGSDTYLFTNLIKGENAFYFWSFYNKEDNVPWNDQTIFSQANIHKATVKNRQADLEFVSKIDEEAEVFGIKSATSTKSRSLSTTFNGLLITAEDQVYYETNYGGYYHVNQSDFIFNQDPNGFEPTESGELVGHYRATDHVLEHGGYVVNLYEIDGAYAFIVEDLSQYGYGLYYNNDLRMTIMKPGGNKDYVHENGQMVYKTPPAKVGSSGSILRSDITVFIGQDKVKTYNIGGYSLVKLEDYLGLFDYGTDAYKIRYKTSGQKVGLQGLVSGTISLPAPSSQDLKGSIVLYASNQAPRFDVYSDGKNLSGRRIKSLNEIYKQTFNIKSGDLNYDFRFSTDQVKKLNTYDFYFLGYKLEPNGSNQEYLTDAGVNKGLLLELNPINKNHINTDLKIARAARVEGLITFKEPVYYVDSSLDRQVVLSLIKRIKDGSREKLQDELTIKLEVKQGDIDLPVNFLVDTQGTYEFAYQVNLHGGNQGAFRIYEEGFIPLKVPGKEPEKWIEVNKLAQESPSNNQYLLDTVEIEPKADYAIAHGYKTDIKTYFNEEAVDSVNMEGQMMAPLDTLTQLGLSYSYNFNERVVYVRDEQKESKSTKKEVHFTMPDYYNDLQVGDYLGIRALHSGWHLSYKGKTLPLFDIQSKKSFNTNELKALGFVVDYNDGLKRLDVKSKSNKPNN